jgi:hypothetical protein
VAIGTGVTWTQVTAGLLFMCGIQSDGSLWCWDEHYEPPRPPGDIPKWFETGYSPRLAQIEGTWTTLSTPYFHTCGIRADGSLWCWNPHGYSQMPIGEDLSWRIVSVAGLAAPVCALRSDRTLWCSASGQGDLDLPIAPPLRWIEVSIGSRAFCGIAADHSLWCWNSRRGGGTDLDLESKSHRVLR